MTRVIDHFAQRVAERIGPHVCPAALARDLNEAIRHGVTSHAEHVMRQGKRRSIWRVNVDGQRYYIVRDDPTGVCITILTQRGLAVAKAKRRGEVKGAREWEFKKMMGWI